MRRSYVGKKHVIGIGAFSVIRTLESLDEYGKSFFVDTFDVSSGKLVSEFFSTPKDLMASYSSSEIVIKVAREITSPEMCTANSHHETECLISFLHAHWKIPLNIIRMLVHQAPEWTLLWLMMTRGIAGQHDTIDKFTSLYTTRKNNVVLCIRPCDTVHKKNILRVYRRFDGDIHSLKFLQIVNTRILMDMVRNVLMTMMYLAMYNHFHHFDIKPSNILYRVNENGDVETRLTDYDSLCRLGNKMGTHEVHVIATEGYRSPLYPDFDKSFSAMKLKSPLAPEHLTVDDVQNSWKSLLSQHVRSKRAPKYCDQLNQVITKHDLYSLGCTLAYFRVKNKVHSRLISVFIEDMLMADDIEVPNLRIRLNDEYKADTMNMMTKSSVSVSSRKKKTRIMTISDAINRLDELRVKLKL
jgi:serine/threonine protein kinase